MKKALILAGIYWNDPWQRHQQFATYLSKMGYHVFFVEHIVSTAFSAKKLLRAIKRKNSSSSKLHNEIPERITIFNGRFINPCEGSLSIINKKKVTALLSEIGRDFDLVINYLPISTTRYLISNIKYSKLIYDCVRNFEDWGEYSNNIINEETWLINQCDCVFTDSYYLTDKISKSSAKRFKQFLPLASDRWIEGCESRDIPKKILKVGYFGSLDSHIDTACLKELVNQGYEVHVWGNVIADIDFKYSDHGFLSDLKVLAHEVTTTVDAIVLPYKGNMDGVIPAKLLQCLATNLPVFISIFYDSKALEEVLYLYENSDDLTEKMKMFDFLSFEERKSQISKFMRDKHEKNQFSEFKQEISR